MCELGTLRLLVDEIYSEQLPRQFAVENLYQYWHCTQSDWQVLLAGVANNADYWGVWESVLAEAVHPDDDQIHTWSLYLDGDLWALRDDHKWGPGAPE